jgi:hypothetical protein
MCAADRHRRFSVWLPAWPLRPNRAFRLQPEGRGLLFGCERFGMSNDDVYRCDVALSIPSNPQFGSLNLGAAIQVVAYDWRQALGGFPWWSTRPSRSAPMWRRWAACWATGRGAGAHRLSGPGRAQEADAAPQPACSTARS